MLEAMVLLALFRGGVNGEGATVKMVKSAAIPIASERRKPVLAGGNVDAQGYARIQKGMTRQDVIKILGQPSRLIEIPCDWCACVIGSLPVIEGEVWSSEDAGILVLFDKRGHVTSADYFKIHTKRK